MLSLKHCGCIFLCYCKIKRKKKLLLALESTNQLHILLGEFHVKENLRLYVFFKRPKIIKQSYLLDNSYIVQATGDMMQTSIIFRSCLNGFKICFREK